MSVDFAKFPARVTQSDGTVSDPCAVVVDLAGKRARFASRRPDQSAREQLAHDDVATVEYLPNRDTLVTFADGTSWTVGVGEGCACGSPLKNWFSQVVGEFQ